MFEAMKRLTATNKIAPHRQGFRFEDGMVKCTNMVTTMSFLYDKAASLNCFVDGAEFTDAVKSMTAPELEQRSDCLVIREGKYSVDLALQDELMFPTIKPPEGDVRPVGNVLDALSLLKPFFKNAKVIPCASLVYILDDWVYYSTGDIIVRTPLQDVRFDEITILTKEFVDLIVGLDMKPIQFVETSFEIGVWYEGGWIRTKQHGDPPPVEFDQICQPLIELEIPELDADLYTGLVRMCKQDTVDGTVNFDSNGIVLNTEGKVRPKLAIPMPKVAVKAKLLKQVLSVAKCVSFDYDERMIAFRGDLIEGFLSVAPGEVKR